VLPSIPDAGWLWSNEPCRAACPVHTDAGAYVTAIAEGRERDAYLVARAHNPGHNNLTGKSNPPISSHWSGPRKAVYNFAKRNP